MGDTVEQLDALKERVEALAGRNLNGDGGDTGTGGTNESAGTAAGGSGVATSGHPDKPRRNRIYRPQSSGASGGGSTGGVADGGDLGGGTGSVTGNPTIRTGERGGVVGSGVVNGVSLDGLGTETSGGSGSGSGAERASTSAPRFGLVEPVALDVSTNVPTGTGQAKPPKTATVPKPVADMPPPPESKPRPSRAKTAKPEPVKESGLFPDLSEGIPLNILTYLLELFFTGIALASGEGGEHWIRSSEQVTPAAVHLQKILARTPPAIVEKVVNLTDPAGFVITMGMLIYPSLQVEIQKRANAPKNANLRQGVNPGTGGINGNTTPGLGGGTQNKPNESDVGSGIEAGYYPGTDNTGQPDYRDLQSRNGHA